MHPTVCESLEMPAKSKTKTGQQGNVVASAPAEPQSASAFKIETVSSYGGIVVAAVFFYALRKIYYDYVWWDARNEQAREVLFESESALYYSYMKDVVNAPSFIEGIKGLLWHKRTEYPYEMNVIKRFNIFQEIICAASSPAVSLRLCLSVHDLSVTSAFPTTDCVTIFTIHMMHSTCLALAHKPRGQKSSVLHHHGASPGARAADELGPTCNLVRHT